MKVSREPIVAEQLSASVNAMAHTVISLPRGPETPPVQQARQWIERPLELLDTCARQFGDVFTLQLGALGATVMFSNPDAVKTIFSAPARLFECQSFNESYRFVMGDHALFLQDGEKHRQLKRVMAPPLCHEGMEGHARDMGCSPFFGPLEMGVR